MILSVYYNVIDVGTQIIHELNVYVIKLGVARIDLFKLYVFENRKSNEFFDK